MISEDERTALCDFQVLHSTVVRSILPPGRKQNSMATPSQPQPGKDPVKVDPKHYKVEYEDKKVRVLRIKYGPHEKSVMHGHPALVGVFLNDAKTRFTYPDGKKEDISVKAGEVVHFEALEHEPENIGDKPFELIAVELKA
jgi:quercetin dioxygenase-like cupin family protein